MVRAQNDVRYVRFPMVARHITALPLRPANAPWLEGILATDITLGRDCVWNAHDIPRAAQSEIHR